MLPILTSIKTIWQNKFLVLLAAIVVILGVFYAYYYVTSIKITNLIGETARLKDSLEQKNAYIESLRKDYQIVVESREKLSRVFSNTNREVEELRRRFSREEGNRKSLSELSVKKKSLVESRINRATSETIDCFERLSRG